MLLMQGISLRGLGYYFDGVRASNDLEPLYPMEISTYGGVIATRIELIGHTVVRPELADLLQGKGALEGVGASLSRSRHAFIDVVFTCPKSVSLLFGLSSPEVQTAIIAAHVVARDSTLAYLERAGAWVKLPTGTRESVRADGFLWAPFVHHVSRRGDPHLHSHVLIVNLAPSRARGWSPIDSGPLYGERLGGGQLYRAALRHELSEHLGMRFRARSAPGSDVIGFSDRVLDVFSQRQREIVAAQHGDESRISQQHARKLRATVPKKTAEAALSRLRAEWTSQAVRLGVLVERDVALRRSPSMSLSDDVVSLTDRVDDVVERSIDEFRSPFTRSQLVAVAGGALPVGAPVELIESRIEAALVVLETSTDLLSERQQPTSPRYDRRFEQQFVNERVAEAIRHEAAYLQHALSLSDLESLCAGRRAWPEGFEVALISTSIEQRSAYDVLRGLRRAAFGFARPLRLVFATRASRSAFEAATGAELSSSGSSATRAAPGLTVVGDAAWLSVLDRTRTLRSAHARGDVVVLCDSWTTTRQPMHQDQLPLWSSTSTREPRRYELSTSVEAIVVETLAEAIEILRDLHIRLRGSRVVMDRRLRALFRDSTPSRAVARESGFSHGTEFDNEALLVLGDVCSLRRNELGRPRIHVVVAPPETDRSDELALVYAMAGWSPDRRRATLLPREVSDRLAWGWKQAVAHDRVGLRTTHELAPGRITVGGRERQGGNLRAEEQRREITRTVRDAIGWEETLAP